MAKGKKKKKAKKAETVDLSSQNNVTIIVPDAIADLDKKVLHGIGRLTIAATSTFDVTDVAIVKASELPEDIIAFAGWQKSVADE